MKWFMALYNDGSAAARPYDEMLEVALATARRYTNLEPYLLYDGAENAMTQWLRKRGVVIVPARTFLYEPLRQLARETGDERVLGIGAGAYLRLEIPRLAREYGWHDEFVLYTDCDVFFTGEIGEMQALRPRHFAVAPETFLDNYLHANTGVMLLNLPALQTRDDEFRAFNLRYVRRFVRSRQWDQGAFRAFYNPPHRALLNFGFPDRLGYRLVYPYFSRRQWDDLPQIYNWKPYWPPNPDARIVHFHGPKPWHRARHAAGESVPKTLLPMFTDGYQHACDLYEEERARLDD